MSNNEGLHIALHAPNLINICVDDNKGEVLSGRLFHCYTEEAWEFKTIVQMLEKMETLFDAIGYPQASTVTRNFGRQTAKETMKKVKKAMMLDYFE